MSKVLIVDDEPAVLNFLNRLFEDAGYDTVGASDGVVGLKEFFTSQPDVAVVDIMMPNMDGVELCRRIREVSYVPVIVLTALERVDQRVRTFSAGADDYVTKPVSGRELLSRVEACLRRSRWPSAGDVTPQLFGSSRHRGLLPAGSVRGRREEGADSHRVFSPLHVCAAAR